MIRWWTVVLVLAIAGEARAEKVNMSVFAAPDSGVEFTLSTCYDEVPPFGYFPLRVQIGNRTSRDRVWALNSEIKRDYSSSNVMRRTWAFRVPAGGRQDGWVLAPLPPLNVSARSWMMTTFTASGVGLRGTQASYSSQPPGTGLRKTVLIGAGTSDFRKTLKHVGKEEVHYLLGDSSCFPSDVRGYLGIDAIVVTADDLEATSAATRRALEEFMFNGGTIVAIRSDTSEARGVFSFVDRYVPAVHGLGRFEVVYANASNETIEYDVAEVLTTVGARNEIVHRPGALASAYEPIEVKRGLLLLLLVGFGIVIGPVNVFVFARRSHRSRLIWTTPALSLTAGLVLAGSILVEDGVGGAGDRQIVHLLAPDKKAAYAYQVQAARTGLLIGSRLDVPEDVYLDMLPGIADYPGIYDVDQEGHGGDWFRTRRVQAHWMFQRRASRARVTVVRSGDGTPEVSSTIDGALASLIYVDDDGSFWSAEDIQPGVRTRLEKSDRAAFETWRRATLEVGHDLIRTTAASPLSGWFYASAEEPSLGMIPSFEPLRWRNRASAWVGPVTAEAPR